MRGSFTWPLALAAVLAVVFASTASAANSGGFLDGPGDAGNAPDVTGVAISNDDSGTVTVKVTFGNRSAWSVDDGIAVGLDTDQNPDSGSLFYGTEYELDLLGSTLKFYRAAADGFYDESPPPPSFHASFSVDSVTLTFKASELGSPAGFNVYALGFDRSGFDAAPDIRTFNYQFVAGATPPVLAPDHRAPVTHAFKESGVHGKIVQLDYFALDGRGETADTMVITKGKKVLKRLSAPLADTNPFLTYYARWRVPKNVRGKLRFCITSTDRAGNKSAPSCAALTIR
jgi:hypothetical protein